jgi:hypothetical protein
LNVDRYDAILGVVFMKKHNVVLDLAKNRLTINGKECPVLKETEETEIMARRHAVRRATMIKDRE